MFEHKSASYHADFAGACDSILKQYPLGTNKFLEISIAEPSLPQIVRDLRPSRIKVSTNWVWILVSGDHLDGLVVVWEPEDGAKTNNWTLEIGNGEDGSKVVYAARR